MFRKVTHSYTEGRYLKAQYPILIFISYWQPARFTQYAILFICRLYYEIFNN
jgi:hypothetical protein